MKKIKTIILFILITFSKFTIGQSISDLDAKNGFKDFKIGDDYGKWLPFLSAPIWNQDGTSTYTYTGTCCNSIFQYSVAKIALHFKNYKLVAIFITTEKFQKGYSETGKYTEAKFEDCDNINNSFVALFGKATGAFAGNTTNNIITMYWRGENITLASTYQNDMMEGDQQEISVTSNDFISSTSKNKLKDGF